MTNIGAELDNSNYIYTCTEMKHTYPNLKQRILLADNTYGKTKVWKPTSDEKIPQKFLCLRNKH